MINPLTSNACCSKKTNMRFKLKIITCFLVCFALGIFSGCKSLLPRVQILRKVEIGILMPKEELDVNKKSPETLSMQDARELKVFFKNRNLSSEILLFQNVVENPEILSSYKTILVIKQDLWTKSFWKAIDAYIKHGGNVFWQGLKTVEMMPSEYEQKYFDKLCGLKYGDYKYDKILRGKTKKGQSYLEEYIWIKPNQTTDIFSSNARDYYSISAGVKLDIIPTDGIVAASWRSKNKEQEQGAALIVKKYFRGRTAFSSAATLSIASTESPIEKKHARELVMLILNWMEHDINITKTFKVSYKDLFPERSYNSRSLPYTPSYSEKALILQKLSECITPKKQQKLLEFCGLRKINSLYLFIGSPKILQYQKSAKLIEKFIVSAEKKNISIHAITGWPEVMTKKNNEKIIKILKSIIIFNSENSGKAEFKSILLNPYIKEQKTLPNLTILNKRMKEKINASKNSKLALGVIIPVPMSKYFSMDSSLDYCVIEEVSDYAPGIIDNTASFVDKNRKVLLEIETNQFYGRQRNLSFYEEGLNEMEKELTTVAQYYNKNKEFKGFIISDYETFSKLPNKTNLSEKYPLLTINTQKMLFPLKIDGIDNEWIDVHPVNIYKPEQIINGWKNWHGERDCSMLYRVAWDKKNLYYYFNITDEDLVFENKQNNFKGDSIMLNIALENLDQLLNLTIKPSEKQDKRYGSIVSISSSGKSIVGIPEMITMQTDTGYCIECKIPFKTSQNLSPATKFHTIITLTDKDTGEEESTVFSDAPLSNPLRKETFNNLILLPVF